MSHPIPMTYEVLTGIYKACACTLCPAALLIGALVTKFVFGARGNKR